MTASVTHSAVVVVADDGTSPVGTNEWNAGHTVSISAADVGAAPDSVDYLVGTASGGLSGEIAVGTTPGGELGNTWASPTVDATHSGSTHAATQAAAEATAAGALSTHAAAADPHTGYVREDLLDAAGDTYMASADNTPAKLVRGTVGQFKQTISTTDPALGWTDVFTPVVFSKSGAVAVTTEGDSPPPMRWYNDTGRTLTFASARATATTAPAGSAMTIDVNVDGTTIMTGTKVVIADGTNTVKQSTFSTTTVADGHYISVNVDAIGSGTAGSNLTVVILLKG